MVTSDTATTTPSGPGFWDEAVRILEDVDEATGRLSASKTVDPQVAATVRRLVEAISATRPESLQEGDPYLVEALLVGVVGCAKAMWLGDEVKQRAELRLPLERARQALRDLVSEKPVSEGRPPKELARWLLEVSRVSQQDIADLLHVAPRTLQRWISPTESASPSGEEEVRVRTLARTVDQLRWSMTANGVLRWLGKPHPSLNGRSPAELLGDPVGYSVLPKLAAETRAMVAS